MRTPAGPDWAHNLLRTCLGMQPGEQLLVLTDPPLAEAGQRLLTAARALTLPGPELHVVQTAPDRLQVVSRTLLTRVAAADGIVALFGSLPAGHSHPVLRAALAAFREAGHGRWALGHALNPAHLAEELGADCQQVAHLAAVAARQLTDVRHVRITTEAGTDLRLDIGGRPVQTETGLLRSPGAFCNLPAGEVYVAPLEESVEGDLVVDVSAGGIGLRQDEPLRLTFRQGRLVTLSGPAAPDLERLLGADPMARVAGEFGIGVNPVLKLTGRTAVDEKVLGTAHIALGANTSFGGRNQADVHCDCVIRSPHISLDGVSFRWPDSHMNISPHKKGEA